MRFQDAARDGRAVVYAGIQADPLVAEAAQALADASMPQRLMARAVMNGTSNDAGAWRTMFPSLFGASDVASGDRSEASRDRSEASRYRSEALLSVALRVADHGEQVRSQLRGAIVEELTERLLARRSGIVRRERRVLFDGIPAEIHPYDVTLEDDRKPEIYDCKWGARGINDEVLLQLDAARTHAADEGRSVLVGLVIYDAARSCAARLARSTAPRAATRIVPLESLDRLARGWAPSSARPS